ncbi:T9SS type A sorting domain-containing protein [Mangrovimonas cancribranchiae]|uniref:T9SS type A sorting domain-containing protein n=1 Tax=Mangrovimonas cancribranchiae TaxID=3080055 RepID=A0AAU6NWA0_9FLAO
MKKILFLGTLLCAFMATAQFNQDAPWMQELNINQRSATNNPVTFNEIVTAFNTYWETRNPNTKGSGFKPFKRWQNYWQNFVNEEGVLPTPEELWTIWESAQSRNSNRVDESNWYPIGPFEHTNTGSWSSGQGRVNAITVDPNNPNVYYSGAPAGGLWKSIDGGVTWTTTTDNLPQIGVSGIAIDYNDSNTIYIATGDDDAGDSYSVGVLKSTDGGLTWNTTGLNTSNSPSSMNDIYIHPSNSNILWVATNSGVYKSLDAGTTWTNTLSGNIKDIKLKPGDPSTIYAVSSSVFYKSTNGGDSFSSVIGQGLPFTSSRLVIDVTPANSNVVYVLSADGNNAFGGLFKSTSSGTSFTETASQATVGDIFESTQAWYDMAMAVSDVNENEVYVGVLNIWKTTNSGTSFTKLNYWNAPFSAGYTHADIHLLRFFNGELYAGTDGGFYKSSDSGANFTDLTEGMQISQFYKIAVSKQTSDKMVGGLQDNGGHALNNNQWQNYYGADGMDTAIDPANPDMYYGFTQFGGSLNVSNSAGGGLNAQINSPDSEQGNWVTPLVMNSESELYAGFSSLYKLCGSSWQVVSPSFGENIDKLEIDDLNPDNIYIAINSSLRKSTNRGVSFSTVQNFSSSITSIEVNNGNSDILYVTTSGLNGGVYKSIDGGVNFSNITGSLPGVTKNVIKHQDLHTQNPLYLGTYLGVYRYDDTTQDWEPFNIGLPTVSITDLEINTNDNKITAATYGRGIWQSNLQTETVANEIALTAILGLEANFNCGNELSGVEIEVENLGSNSVTTVDVNYSLDGTENTFTWNGNIPAGETAIIPLPTQNITIGNHELEVISSFSSDSYSSNNKQVKYFYTNLSGEVNQVNTFETESDELLVSDGGSCGSGYWQRGVPTGALLNLTSSGTQVYGTNLSGDYDNNIKSHLVSRCYNLTQLNNPELKFNMAYNLEEDWDIVYMEYSTDSGASWHVLGTANDPNWYNSDTTEGENNTCFNCPGAQWTGTNPFMIQYSYDLSGFTSESNIMFRFVFHSDQAVVEEGVIVDDFEVSGVLSVEDTHVNRFQVYPNPSSLGYVNIKMSQPKNFDISIVDITGKIVLQEQNIQPNSNKYTLNLSQLASGVYLLNLEQENRKITKKLIVN